MFEMIALAAKYATLIVAFIGFLGLGFMLLSIIFCLLTGILQKLRKGINKDDPIDN